ncbi:MAG: TIGR01212 family radical SAM protein [Planctomycetes bacterium]|nr:TIGR01212 family radical SAM protein [Planctomycetota bacterium]
MIESGGLPFRSYASYLRERFGETVYKVGLDARMTCPNIDGTVAKGGCTFCTNPSFSFQPLDAASRLRDVREQLRRGTEFYRRRRGARRFIAYFQTYTNTYAPPESLRALYGSVLDEEGVAGLAIATRPDCLPEPVVDVLEEFASRTNLTVELGLQTANDATLRAINRGHTLADFRDAAARLIRRRLSVKVHLLFGLPGDGDEDALRSVAEVNACGAEGVKLHHLQVLRSTRLGRDYLERQFPTYSLAEYSSLLNRVMAALDPSLFVDRLFATCREDLVLAPSWGLPPAEIRRRLINSMRDQGIRQGCRFSGRPGGSRLSACVPIPGR